MIAATGIAALALTGLAPLSAQAAPGRTFFASPDGRDTGQCTQSQPCSIDRAQELVRAAPQKGKVDLTVQLADGTYRLTEPLKYRSGDGGSADHPVTWQAAPGAHPEITGASRVTGWKSYDATSNIYVASTPVGLDTRQLYVNGTIAPRASIKLANSDVTPTATGLAINNPALAYLATLPNQGRIEFESLGDFTNRYSPVQSISPTMITMTQPAWDNNTWGWDTVQRSFLAGPSWNLDNSLSFLTQTGQWYIDPTAGKVYYKPAAGVDPNSLDVELPRLQALVSIGGTYEAPVTGLAFTGIQFSGTSWLEPSSADGYADQQNGLFLKGNYSYRPADAFTSCSRGCEQFERARTDWFQEPGAVQVSAASHISFTGDTFTNLGQTALGIGNDANATVTGVGLGAGNISVIGSRFMEDSGHGIAVGGVLPDAHHPSDPRMTNHDVTIKDNTVNHVSVDYKDNGGIFSTYVTNASIVHNEVSNVPYDGIDTGYGWGINDAGGSNDYVDRGYYNWNPKYTTPTTLKDNVVANNLVHNTKTRFADGGTIYNLSASPGTVVENNYLFDFSGVGLYLDEGSRSMTYQNNVMNGGGAWAFTNASSSRNNTSDNVLQNNWYNSGGASAPNATAHNNQLINNTKITGVAWPAAAQAVICDSGVEPQYRTSLNANLFGFTGCSTNSPVSGGLKTASSATSSYFGQSGSAYGIAAQGADVWGAGGQHDDQYGTIYGSGAVSQDSSVTARVVSVDDANAWAKSGVMMRNNLSQAGVAGGYALVAVTARNGVVFAWDSNGDGYIDQQAQANIDVLRPVWVKLTRLGNQFTGSYSYDGANYTPIGSPVTLADATATQDAGLFSTSHDTTRSDINIFDSLSLRSSTAPAAPTEVTSTTGDGVAQVSWKAPTDGGSALTGYTAVATPGGASCTAVAPATTCRISGLQDGSSYTFAVTAANIVGTSAASASSAPVTLSHPVGGDAVSLTVSAKAQCINGTPSLAVYVANKESSKVKATIVTDLGKKKISRLAAGSAKYATFRAPGHALAAGTGTITTEFAKGTAHRTVYSVAYQAVNCR